MNLPFLQVSNIHRGSCSSLDVSHDGKHLATAGDRVVKIWDYHMRLDINFQVFLVRASGKKQTQGLQRYTGAPRYDLSRFEYRYLNSISPS